MGAGGEGKSSWKRTVCLSVCCLFVLLIIGIGIAAAIIGTRFQMPSTTIQSMDSTNNASVSGTQFQAQYKITTQIVNNNMFDILISEAVVNTYLNQTYFFGKGVNNDFNMPRDGVAVNLTTVINGEWDSSTDNGKSVSSYIKQECGLLGSGKLNVYYTIDVSVKAFMIGPFKINQITGNTQAPCPFNVISIIL
ncbi:hypothetical protein MP228_008743 [Amoeboaphelidium protococcarum]|nr:hypothetical protein MP228_008743 [Amoeboaphelidium protococcarum]